MKEKIFIVKSHRDFAKAQGEDTNTNLETMLFIINSKLLKFQFYQFKPQSILPTRNITSTTNRNVQIQLNAVENLYPVVNSSNVY